MTHVLEHLADIKYKVYAMVGAVFGFGTDLLDPMYGDLIFDSMRAFIVSGMGAMGAMLVGYFFKQLTNKSKDDEK